MISDKLILPELLAPAGDMQCLKAAVSSGADAVYFGAKEYNARAFAGNFKDEELERAFYLCRMHGVKIYLTFNTLATEKEFSGALAYVSDICEKFKPDGVIVQDVGLARRIYGEVGVPIVASTQMAQHSALGANLLKSLGVFRVVAAREMTLGEIVSMKKKSGLEVEMFVHGAICVCQSGGCLMSSIIGRRSGNRGECAQPCRLPYNGAYPLSLKDMCLAGHITEIISAGIDSLKIEGRMRSAEYVGAVTSVYRRLLDERRNATNEEIKFLEAVFSRGGFTDAYFSGTLSRGMFGIRSESDKKRTAELDVKFAEKKIPVALKAVVSKEETSVMMSAGGIIAKVNGKPASDAKNSPVTEDGVRARLSKTGGTEFSVKSSEINVGEDLFVAVGELNAMRRECAEKLAEGIIKRNTPVYAHAETAQRRATGAKIARGLCVRLDGRAASDPYIFEKFADSVVFFDVPVWKTELLKKYADAYGEKVRAMLPRCVYPTDEDEVRALCSAAEDLGVRTALCSGFAQYDLCGGMVRCADLTANANDRESVAVYADAGFSSLCVSPELKSGAVRALSGILPLEMICYGRLPLMHTRTCIVESAGKAVCARNKQGVCSTELIDRVGAKFPVFRAFKHDNTVFNSVPIWLADRRFEIESCGVSLQTLLFTDESDERAVKITGAFIEGRMPDAAVTRGYFG